MSDAETFEALVQWYRPAPPNPLALVATLDTRKVNFATGMAFDAFGNLYVTTFDSQTVTKFDTQRNRTGTFESKFGRIPESIPFDVAGNAYVGQSGDVKAPGARKTSSRSMPPTPFLPGSTWPQKPGAPTGLIGLPPAARSSTRRNELL